MKQVGTILQLHRLYHAIYESSPIVFPAEWPLTYFKVTLFNPLKQTTETTLVLVFFDPPVVVPFQI